MNHEFLLHKLSEIGMSGRVYMTIKAMYSNPISCVNINGRLSEWFHVGSGVRQGDSLSPTLFAIFINDLAVKIPDAKLGVQFHIDDMISLLLYADDIVLVAPSHNNCQKMLDIVTSWCRRWGMKTNIGKSEVVHVRNPQRPWCSKDLYLDSREMKYVS